jgi:hypothetical protein
MGLLRKEERLPKIHTILQEAITAVQGIEDDNAYNLTINELSSCLQTFAPDLLMTTVKKIRACKSKIRRAYALTIMADHLPALQQPAVLNEALVAAKLISEDLPRAYALRTVASGLPLSKRHNVLAETLRIAQIVEDETWKKNVLRITINHVSPDDHDLLAQGLEIARSINGVDRSEALSNVALRLPPDQKISVLTESFSVAQAIESEWQRSNSVLTIARNLPPEAHALQRDILQSVYELVNERTAFDIIEVLVPYWLEMFENDTRSALIAFSEALDYFSQTERSMLLKIIEMFAPLIHQLGGERAVRESSEAIIDTTQWWP